jgi:hypothetical protein
MEARWAASGSPCRAALFSMTVFAFDFASLGCGRVVTELGSESVPGSGAPPFDASASAEAAIAAAEAAADVSEEEANELADAASDVLWEAASDAPEVEAAVCRGDLSNIGTADFHISFSVTTTQSGVAALVNQRATCTLSDFWDVRLSSNGALDVETVDATQGANGTGLKRVGSRINDGVPHKVLLQRTSGTLTVYLDGTPAASAPSLTSFRQLAPLRIGTDVCTVAIDGTKPLIGTVSDVCVASP